MGSIFFFLLSNIESFDGIDEHRRAFIFAINLQLRRKKNKSQSAIPN